MANGIYQFTESIQLKILALMWRDLDCFTLYKRTIKPKYFENPQHMDVARIVFNYWEEYESAPTKDALIQEIDEFTNTKSKKPQKDAYFNLIETLSSIELTETQYLKDSIVDFGKKQAMVEAILDSAELLEKGQEIDYDKILNNIEKAIEVGDPDDDFGEFLFDPSAENVVDKLEERITAYAEGEDPVERLPFADQVLNSTTGGGIGKGEMAICLAATGVGKTTWMISTGGHYVREGYNVLHFSLENNEKTILRNYDLRTLEKSLDYIKENSRASIKALAALHKLKKGNLNIKKYPTKSVTVADLRAYTKRLIAQKGFIPDVITVDYGALLKPSGRFENERTALANTYEELRGLGQEFNCVLITAIQANRGALAKKIVTLGDIGESFATAAPADFVVALCQTAKEKAQNEVRLFTAKVRDSESGKVFSGNTDHGIKKMSFHRDVTDEMLAESEKGGDSDVDFD